MKYVILFLLMPVYTQAQWNIKAGVLVPTPFYVPTEYTIHPSSALVEADYKKNKSHFAINTGYIRLKGPDLFQCIPLIFSGKYDINNVYVGIGAGPSYISEYRNENFKMLYNFKMGVNSHKWTIELNYFNWEELPDELNTLCIGIFYKLK